MIAGMISQINKYIKISSSKSLAAPLAHGTCRFLDLNYSKSKEWVSDGVPVIKG